MVKANFKTYASYVTDSLYQWDLNQVLSVTGLNLAVTPEVHFSNANMDRAIVRQATMVDHVVSVAIPNSLLQDPFTIRAYIGIYEDDTFKVVERVDIPIIPRARPNDYRIEDTDEEIYSFKALENMIANIDERWTNYTDEKVETSVDAWLIAHPEATTTVQDGELTERKFSDGLRRKKASRHNTVSDMIADNGLIAGMIVVTSGYYAVNDGGGASYIIREKDGSYVENVFNVSIDDTYFAELIIENNTVNVRQLGATPENDLHDYILQYVNKCENETRVKLYIPSGKWQCTETEIFARRGFHIYGDRSFNMRGYSVEGTIITAKNDNQEYVLKIGNTDLSESTDQPTANFVLDDIVFSSAVYGDTSVTSFNHVTKGVLVLSGATLGFVNCIFQNIDGTALYINDSWEIYFGKTNFRFVGDLSTPVVCFGKSEGTTSSGSNISAIEFDTMMFESVAGDCILFESGCRFDGNKIGHINAELGISDINAGYADILETNEDDVGTHYMSLIKCHDATGLIIGDINLQMLNRKVLSDGKGNRHVYKYVFDIPEGGFVQGSIGSVFANNLGKNAKLLRAVSPNFRTELHFLDALFWEETLCQVAEESLLDLTAYTTVKNMGMLHRKKEHNCETETHNSLPFYKIASVSIANKIATLNSDETSLTPLKIVSVLPEGAANRVIGRLYNDTASKMLVRVKAPVGDCQLQVLSKQGGEDWHTFIEFTGTGNWQYVTVDTTMCDEGAVVRFADPSTNYELFGKNLMFDVIKFIPV